MRLRVRLRVRVGVRLRVRPRLRGRGGYYRAACDEFVNHTHGRGPRVVGLAELGTVLEGAGAVVEVHLGGLVAAAHHQVHIAVAWLGLGLGVGLGLGLGLG